MDERVNKWKICIFIIFFISFINPASSQTAVEWNDKGVAFAELGEYDKAIEAYNKAIAIDPNYKIAWNNKGAAFLDLGEYKKAIEAFDRSIIIDPNDKEVWFIKGVAFAGLGEYNKSIEASDRALAIDPNYKEAWYGKGIALGFLGRYEEAIKSYDKALEIDPQFAEAWVAKGDALGNLGEYDKAIEAYDRAIAIDPNYKEAWVEKGRIFYELGDYNKATEAFGMSERQGNDWIIISGIGIAIFIIIGIIVLRNRKNKSNNDTLKNPNNTDYKINEWKMFCQKCGVELKEDSKFCSSCGFSLQGATIKEKKGIIGQFIELFKLSYNEHGRFNRHEFGMVFFVNVSIILLSLTFVSKYGDILNSWEWGIFTIYMIILFIAGGISNLGAVIRRWHDLGKSDWYLLLSFVPLLNIVVLIYLLFKKGKELETH